MAQSSAGTVIMLAIGGVAIWWLYENYFSAPAASAAPSGTPTSGSPPVAAGGTSASGVAPVSSSGTPATSTQPAPVSGPSLASISASFQTEIANNSSDPALTNTGGVIYASPDVFNYYLQQVYSAASGWPLDMSAVFPGQSSITLAQFWSGVTPYLQKLGLSGIMSGLGYLVNAGRNWPEIATNPWNGGDWPAGGGYWWQGGAGRAVQ